MNEEPKSIWKRSWTGWRGLALWFVALFVTAFFIIFFMSVAYRLENRYAKSAAFAVICGVGVALIAILLFVFIRWLCCWKNFRRVLFACACLVTSIALFYAEEDWRGWHAWNQFKHKWEAKGEKFDWQSVVPPPVPNDQNFAMAPIWVESMKAMLGPKNSRQWFGSNYAENGRTNFVYRFDMPLTKSDSDWPTNSSGNWQKARLTDLKPWQNYYRALAATTNLFSVAPQPESPALDVLLALSKYDSTIEELRQAGQRPYSQFPLYSNPDHPFDTLLPHLAALKRCTQVLQLRTIAELQAGQSEKALDDVKLMLRLTDAVRTEPFLISHLVRIAMVSINLQSIWEGLAEHKWTDAQLIELDAGLARLDFLADYELSMRGERICAISALDYIRRTHDTTQLQGGDERHHPVNLGWLIPSALFYQNELTIARMHQQWTLPLVDLESRTVSPATVRRSQLEADQQLTHHWWPYKFVARMLFPAFEKAVEKFAYAQESVDLARVAIALERYRLAHGEYPDSLDALAPQLMQKIPHDIIGGGPLHYRRTDDGQFVLYSVGWNETDDGGVVEYLRNSQKMVDIDRGDWVWRYPAK
ncbi:MAG: hypothetical protein ABSA45_08185 [Verrucomicrobiota bacterium]|jgi:hypothetical protein